MRTASLAVALAAAIVAAASCASGEAEVPQLTPLEGSNHRADPLPRVTAPEGMTPYASARFRLERLDGALGRLRRRAGSYDHERAVREGAANDAFRAMDAAYETYATAYRAYLNEKPEKRDPQTLVSLAAALADAQRKHFDAAAAWVKESGDVHSERLAIDLDVAQVEHAAGRVTRKVAMEAKQLKK